MQSVVAPGRALLGVTDQRLWRSLEALVDAARAEVSMATVTAVGIDEKHVGRIGVVSVVHDAGSGVVLHLSAGAKAANLGAFVAGLHRRGGAASAGGCDLLASLSSGQARQRGDGKGAAGRSGRTT